MTTRNDSQLCRETLKFLLAAGFMLAIVCSTNRAVAQAPGASNIVVPKQDAASEGSASATYPFSQSSMRYQQVYSADQLPGFGMISEIAFRPDGSLATGANVLSPVLPTQLTHVKIVLSTTRRAPGNLSTSFADNLGRDQVVVYDGPWSFSTSYAGEQGGPNAFDVRIRLMKAFFYSRFAGNLLVDITLTSSASNIPMLDAEGSQDEAVSSRVYAPSAAATTATGSDSKGLVTQFTFGSFAVANHCGAQYRQLAWIVFQEKFAGIQAINESLADKAFNNACTFIAGSPLASSPTSKPVPVGWSSIPLASLESFTNFRRNLLTVGAMAPGFQTILYDNENWPQTPSYERVAPADYETLFANLAHAYGYAFLAAPATDLVKIQIKPIKYDPTQPTYNQYVSMNFPTFSVDAPAEAYDIQAQGSEPSESRFDWFVNAAACQAYLANPEDDRYHRLCSNSNSLDSQTAIENPMDNDGNFPAAPSFLQDFNWRRIASPPAVILAGVSTNPSGQTVTANQMFTVVQDTKSEVSGYWLNVPDNDYQMAVSFLEDCDQAGLLKESQRYPWTSIPPAW